MTFAPRYTDWPDLLSPLYARDGNIDGDDADPDVDVNNPTSGQTSEFDLKHTTRNKHIVGWESIILSAEDSIVLEFRKVADGLYEQGATAYRIKELGSSDKTNPVDAANLPIGDWSPGRVQIDSVVTITGAGLAEPTKVESMDWDTVSEMHDCIMTNDDKHDRVRFRIIGAATFVSGSFTLISSE